MHRGRSLAWLPLTVVFGLFALSGTSSVGFAQEDDLSDADWLDPGITEGRRLLEAGKYAEAAAKFSAVLDHAPTDSKLTSDASVRDSVAAARSHLGVLYLEGQGVPQDLARGVELVTQGAEGGNVFAQFTLANLYLDGKGVPQDDVKAVQWARKAAERNHAASALLLGQSYAHARGVSFDEREAGKWIGLAAMLDYAPAQYAYGVYVLNSTPSDPAQAARYFSRGAELGEAEAQNELGKLYVQGRGVPQDVASALRLFQLSADGGSVNGLTNLGVVYREGMITARDNTKAAGYLAKAADRGHPLAQFVLAEMYLKGEGVKQDNTHAVALYKNAADQAFARAEIELGWLHGTGRAGLPVNAQEATRLYDLAAQHGDAAIKVEIAQRFLSANGVPFDKAKAVAILTPPAERGYAAAQNMLGVIYSSESLAEPKKDMAKAAQYYRAAAEQGDPAAQGNLAGLYYMGDGVKQDFAEAYLWAALAAKQGNANGALIRDNMSKQMTAEQITQMESAVQRWLDAHR